MASASRSYSAITIAAVPDLDEHNWVDWIRRIEDALVNKNYLYKKIMEGDLVRPIRAENETQESYNTRFDKWDELQIQGRSIVSSKVGPTALLYSKTKGKIIADGKSEDDLKTLFADLQTRFRPQGVATFNRLQSSLLNLRLDDCKDITEYNETFVQLDGQLSLLSENTRLPVSWMIGLYLNNLPSSYDIFKSHWISNNNFVDGTKSNTILSELMEAVQKEESLMKTPGRTALLGHTLHGAGGGDKAEVKCRHCGKLYHTDAECVVKHPHLKSALDKRLKAKRANRDKKRAELKSSSSSDNSSSHTTSKEETKITAHLAIRGCASAEFEPAFEFDE
jgi:hypothetical protein